MSSPPIASSLDAIRFWHSQVSHLVEDLATNSVLNALPRQRSSSHFRSDDRLVTKYRVLDHAPFGKARALEPLASPIPFDRANVTIPILDGDLLLRTRRRVPPWCNDNTRPSSCTVGCDRLVHRLFVVRAVRRCRRQRRFDLLQERRQTRRITSLRCCQFGRDDATIFRSTAMCNLRQADQVVWFAARTRWCMARTLQ